MATPPTTHPAYALVVDFAARAEQRGLDEGHYARVQDDGSILVKAHSADRSYRVMFFTDPHTHLIRFRCDCPAGRHPRNTTVPCKHATRAARRLEREGLAFRTNGLWYDQLPREETTARSPEQVIAAMQDDDPFADVERYTPRGAA